MNTKSWTLGEIKKKYISHKQNAEYSLRKTWCQANTAAEEKGLSEKKCLDMLKMKKKKKIELHWLNRISDTKLSYNLCPAKGIKSLWSIMYGVLENNVIT